MLEVIILEFKTNLKVKNDEMKAKPSFSDLQQSFFGIFVPEESSDAEIIRQIEQQRPTSLFPNPAILWTKEKEGRYTIVGSIELSDDGKSTRETALLNFSNIALRINRGSTIPHKKGTETGTDSSPLEKIVFTAPDSTNHALIVTEEGSFKKKIISIGSEVTLYTSGEHIGALEFSLDVDDTMADDLDIGLRYFMPAVRKQDTAKFPKNESEKPKDHPLNFSTEGKEIAELKQKGYVTSLRYPVFDFKADSKITFNVFLDPASHLDGTKTYFEFPSDSEIPSHYRTVLGHQINLKPEAVDAKRTRLIFEEKINTEIEYNPGTASEHDVVSPYYLVPDGNFKVTVEGFNSGNFSQADFKHNLMCGLSGVEYIGLEPYPGDIEKDTYTLSFVPGKPAYSPAEYVFDKDTKQNTTRIISTYKKLTATAKTSWCYISADDPDHNLVYYAQPDSSVLHKYDEDIDASTVMTDDIMLKYLEVPAARIPKIVESGVGEDKKSVKELLVEKCYPMVPYAGVYEEELSNYRYIDDYKQMEVQAISPERKGIIDDISIIDDITTPENEAVPEIPKQSYAGVTSQGLKVIFGKDTEKWRTLSLARSYDKIQIADQPTKEEHHYFDIHNFDKKLKQSFQTNQQFLVISDLEELKKHATLSYKMTDLSFQRLEDEDGVDPEVLHKLKGAQTNVTELLGQLPDSFIPFIKSNSENIPTLIDDNLGTFIKNSKEHLILNNIKNLDSENKVELFKSFSDTFITNLKKVPNDLLYDLDGDTTVGELDEEVKSSIKRIIGNVEDFEKFKLLKKGDVEIFKKFLNDSKTRITSEYPAITDENLEEKITALTAVRDSEEMQKFQFIKEESINYPDNTKAILDQFEVEIKKVFGDSFDCNALILKLPYDTSRNLEKHQNKILFTSENEFKKFFEAVLSTAELETIYEGRKLSELLKRRCVSFKLIVKDWGFDFSPYGWIDRWDTNTLLIFKFCDKSVRELIEDTDLWTNPEVGTKNYNQRRIQNQLKDIIVNDTERRNDESFRYFFDNVVDNKYWNGVLALNANVPFESLPDQLRGLAAGIDPAQFYAHHIGINITPVRRNKDADINDINSEKIALEDSSIFGIIDYKNDSDLPEPVDPAQDPYDFKVKKLKVEFMNSEIKDFSSQIQLRVNELFEESVSLLGAEEGREHLIDLIGIYQKHDDEDIYLFINRDDYNFESAGHVVDRVELERIQFVTLLPKAGEKQDKVKTKFLMQGKMNFHKLPNFDAFSFGNVYDPAKPEEVKPKFDGYLPFSNMSIDMNFTMEIGDEETVTVIDKPFTFNAQQLSYDILKAKPRKGSLYEHFPIKFKRFIQARDKMTPEKMGYMVVDSPLSGDGLNVSGENDRKNVWYGFEYDLNLGTPGMLGKNEDYKSSLMLAWSPNEDDYNVLVGLKIPGVNAGKRGLDIQGILKLGFKELKFTATPIYDDPKDPSGWKTAYILQMRNIQLKIFTKAFPAEGQTNILMFGNPDGGDRETVAWYAAYDSGRFEKVNEKKGKKGEL